MFYHNREEMKTADIVCMPYNYLLSSGIRATENINLKDSILIIDEAHNIIQAAEDVMEIDIKSTDLDIILNRELM